MHGYAVMKGIDAGQQEIHRVSFVFHYPVKAQGRILSSAPVHIGPDHLGSCLMVTGMPLTIRTTFLAFAAIYWFIHPCRSVNFLPASVSACTPMPISLLMMIRK